MHLKRQKIPKIWPVKRKGTKYIVKPSFGQKNGIPILVVLRDMLGLAQNRKEVKGAVHKKDVLINGKPARDEKNSLLFFDTLTIVPMKKNYRLSMSEKGKFKLEEISEKDSMKKVSKILDKKMLKGGKIQLNLSDGRNFLSELKCNVNDSVLINLKEKKITECLPLKEKSFVFVFAGKHSGKFGSIEKIKNDIKTAEIKSGNENLNVLIKQIMVVEK